MITDTRDFVYDDGTYVERGTEYHIHTILIQKKRYTFEGVHSHESETIILITTLLGQYIGIRGKKPEKEYLKSYDWSPTKKDIKRVSKNI